MSRDSIRTYNWKHRKVCTGCTKYSQMYVECLRTLDMRLCQSRPTRKHKNTMCKPQPHQNNFLWLNWKDGETRPSCSPPQQDAAASDFREYSRCFCDDDLFCLMCPPSGPLMAPELPWGIEYSTIHFPVYCFLCHDIIGRAATLGNSGLFHITHCATTRRTSWVSILLCYYNSTQSPNGNSQS